MAELESFEDVFRDGTPSYSAQRCDNIIQNRRGLGNKLFFDRLLDMMRIDHGSKLYPPKSTADLQKLHVRVSECSTAVHQRQSLMYYLLLDMMDANTSAWSYASDVGLPKKYVTLMDGLWYLDQLDFTRALDSLTAPSLIPTLTEETLNVLCEHPKSDPWLALSYCNTVAPIIRDPQVLDKVFKCVCATSATEAFFFSRKQGGSVHRHLFGELITNILSMETDGTVRAEMAEELVQLPLNSEEESWFEDFLTTRPGCDLSGGSSCLIMRLLIKGRAEDAARLARTNSEKSVDGLSWKRLLQSVDT